MSPKPDLRVRKKATLSSDCTAPRSVTKGQARSKSVISSPGMTSGSEGEAEKGFLEKFKTGWDTVIPVGDPDELPPCPSGVSALPKPAQV